jgi:hypothetical protein
VVNEVVSHNPKDQAGGSADFELARFVQEQGGYLSKYREEIGERNLSGIKIVERVAQNFS